jgi:hypothetical protein
VLPQSLIQYRQTGVLRRLSLTPIPPSWLLAAQVVINLAIVLAGFFLLTAAGVAAFGHELPKNILGFLLAYLLTITSLFAVGLCIAALIKNLPVAQGIGGVLFFALMFFGGVWIPRPVMPLMLVNLSDWTPLDASAYRFGADALSKMGRRQDARQWLMNSLLADPEYPMIWGDLSTVAEEEGKTLERHHDLVPVQLLVLDVEKQPNDEALLEVVPAETTSAWREYLMRNPYA